MGVGHAVGKYRAYIAGDVKRIHDRPVKWNKAVLRPRQRPVDIEEDQAFHKNSDRELRQKPPPSKSPSVSIPVSISVSNR